MAEIAAPEPGEVLRRALLRGRADYNQRFRRAAAQYRGLSAETLGALLRGPLARIVEPLDGLPESRIDALLGTLYDATLRLVGLRLLGPDGQTQQLNALFEQLLPAVAPALAEDPERLVPALINAVHNLDLELPRGASCWLRLMRRLARLQPSADLLHEAGLVAAWRCGLAQLRALALERVARLDQDALVALFGLKHAMEPAELRARLTNPWWLPGSEQPARLRLVSRAGGFIGFGGEFHQPPEVARFGERLYVFDNQLAWELHADAFGARLLRFGTSLPAGDPESWNHFDLDRKGRVRFGDHQEQFETLIGWTSWASTEHTLAVTLGHSHHLFLVALA